MKTTASIFKAYDIRGVVGQTHRRDLGRASGPRLRLRGRGGGREGGGRRAATAACRARRWWRRWRAGLASTGLDVVDIGAVTTPMLYYVAATRGTHGCRSGIQVTGSHNPKDYNGFKMVLAGRAIYGDDIQAPAPAHRGRALHAAAQGRIATMDIAAEYSAAHRRRRASWRAA